MTPKEHLIEAFRRLCQNTPGGVETVAEESGRSSESLKQVLAGTLLKSGEPRGIGPAVQRDLEKAFPGWAADAHGATSAARLASIQEAIELLGTELVLLPPSVRSSAGALLSSLAETPQDAEQIGSSLAAIIASTKRRVAASSGKPPRAA